MRRLAVTATLIALASLPATAAARPSIYSRVSPGASAGLPLRPGPLAAPTEADVPLPILLMAALGLVIALALGIGAVAWALGWDPAWAVRWRHAVAEASHRIGGGWANIADWWRSGP